MSKLIDSPTARAFIGLTAVLIMMTFGWCGYSKCSGAPAVSAAPSQEALAQVLLSSMVEEKSTLFIDHALRLRDISWIQQEVKDAEPRLKNKLKVSAKGLITLRKNMVKSWSKAKSQALSSGVDLKGAQILTHTLKNSDSFGRLETGDLIIELELDGRKVRLIARNVVKTARGWIFGGKVRFAP